MNKQGKAWRERFLISKLWKILICFSRRLRLRVALNYKMWVIFTILG